MLSKYDLTVEEYKARSKDVFADDAAVKGYLAEHPDLKKRYEALPFDRWGAVEAAAGVIRGYLGTLGEGPVAYAAFFRLRHC